MSLSAYTFRHSEVKQYEFSIEALSPAGTVVGKFSFWWTDDRMHLQVQHASVDEAYRRKKLATAAYVLAEQITGVTLLIDDSEGSMTNDAKALWNQPDRPFGRGA